MAKSKLIKPIAIGEVDTVTALKQLKLLLVDFPDKTLVGWVDKELSGYSTDDTLPKYRLFPGTLKANVLNYSTYVSNIGIPLDSKTPEALRKRCTQIELRDSIGALKALSSKGHDSLVLPVPPSVYPVIMKHSLITLTAIIDAHVMIGDSAIPQIISAVDNMIMDILLFLEQEFGSLDDLDIDITKKSIKEVNDIERNISVYIFNDNSVTIGDSNKIADSKIG